VKEKFTEKLQREPRDLMSRKVTEVVRTDGLKLLFADGSWVCYRMSGTEPVVRVYSEASSKEDLAKLSAAAKQWVFD
jgi:phosphomannomutase